MLFNHHTKYYSVLRVGMDMALSLPEVCGVLLGTPGVSLDLSSLSRRTGNSSSNTSKSFSSTTTLYVFRKYIEKTSITKLSRCWLRGFDYLVPSFQKENAGGSAICIHRDLLLDEAMVPYFFWG